MNRSTGVLFPVVVLSVLAVLTFWLERIAHPDETEQQVQGDGSPDSVVEQMKLWRYNSQGQLEYRLISPKMLDYSKQKRSVLLKPTLIYYEPDAPDLTVKSDTSLLRKGGKEIYLFGNVNIWRPASVATLSLSLKTEELTVYTEEKRASTLSSVKLSRGDSWMEGVGMEADQGMQTFSLLSNVRGIVYNPRVP